MLVGTSVVHQHLVSVNSDLSCMWWALKTSGATADGLQEHGSSIQYKANVRRIVTEGEGEDARAVGVQLQDGRVYRGKVSLSNLLQALVVHLQSTVHLVLPGKLFHNNSCSHCVA